MKRLKVLPYDQKWLEMYNVEAAFIKSVLETHCLAVGHSSLLFLQEHGGV